MTPCKYSYLDSVVRKFNHMLSNTDVMSRDHGTGQLEELMVSTGNLIVAKIKFKLCSKVYDIRTAIGRKFLSFVADKDVNTYNQMLAEVTEAEKLHEQQLLAIKQQEAEERKAAIEAAKLAKRLERDEEKFQQAKESLMKNFEERTRTITEVPSSSEAYYYNLGWMASHIKQIKAKLPDYLDNLFVKHFGETSSKTVVNTDRRTSGGFRPQWSYAFSCTLSSIETAPSDIVSLLVEGKKQINNTELMWTLIDNHNFKFGKEQDIDAIKATVPKSMLNWFEEGFNTK